MHQQSCHISLALMDLITSSQLLWDVASRLGLPRDILLWVGPSSIWTLQLRGTHSVLSRLLTLLCGPGTTLQRHCKQGSRLGHPVFRVSFGWQGRIGRNNRVKAPWGLLTLPGILHYDDVIMGAMASRITSLTIVYSTVYSVADQSKHQRSASLAFAWGIHRGQVNSPHKWPVTRKMFLFDDVIMIDSMFDETLDLLIFLLAATVLPGFTATPLFFYCIVDNRIPPPGLFSPHVFLNQPLHIFNCLQQTGLKLSPDFFCHTVASRAWGYLCDDSILLLWLSIWLPNAPGGGWISFEGWEGCQHRSHRPADGVALRSHRQVYPWQ